MPIMSSAGYYPAYNYGSPQVPMAPQSFGASAAPSRSSLPSAARFVTNDYGGGLLDTGANLAHIWNMCKTGLTGGGAVNSAIGSLWRALKGLHGNGIFNGIKGVLGSTLPYAVNSSVFEGAISVIVNGYYLVTGRESFGQFGGNVVGDTMSGFAGGAGAAVGGAIVMAILPFGGVLGTVLTALGGVAGYSMAANAIRHTGIYNRIVGAIRGI